MLTNYFYFLLCENLKLCIWNKWCSIRSWIRYCIDNVCPAIRYWSHHS